MIIDSQATLSDAQALTGTSAVISTNIYDGSSDRNLSTGEPLVVTITFDVALAGTSPTWLVAIQTATDSAFSSPVTLMTSQTFSGAASLPAGKILRYVIPQLDEQLQYFRLSYTMGGTSPTSTVTSTIGRADMAQAAEVFYPKNYTIS
jgi:hypothetical protein